mmetsp:Transcript_55836/g.126173  ORF Transcript_55836/g.126173 Transcript_55836/m.126173 type:complete len:236 (+) Transcript_55836:105-812(+)
MGAQCCKGAADNDVLKVSTAAECEEIMQSSVLDEKPPASAWDGRKESHEKEEPKEPAAEPQAVVLLFEHEGIQTPVTFKRGPAGLIFNNSMPVIIENVSRNGYAESLGVKHSWTLVAIDGQKLQDMKFEGAVAMIDSALNALPRVKEAHFVFGTDEADETRGVVIKSAPAGFTYNTGMMPITVGSVSDGGQADRLGVKVEWTLKSVDEQELTSLKFEDAASLIRAAMKELPQTDS